MHGLGCRNNGLSDRMDRASSSSFPTGSEAHLCHFSSHLMALATHTPLSLASHSTTACNSVFTESLLLINFVSRFLRSGTLLLLVLHVLSAVNGHLMRCPTLQDSLGHTRHRLLRRRLDHRCFSVTACAVSGFTVIVVTEVSASSTTFRLRRV